MILRIRTPLDCASFMNRYILPILACCLAVVSTASAQEDAGGRADPKKKGLEVCLLAAGLLDKADEVVVRSGEGQSKPISLPTSNLSDPVRIAKRSVILSLPATGDEEFGRTVGQAVLPQSGRRFLLLLVPSKEKKLYRCRVVRLDDPNFKAGRVYFLNLSPVPIAGELGKRRFSVAPGKLVMAAPTAQSDLPYYQVRFFYKQGKQTRPFADTRWPYDDRSRAYVIFFAKGRRLTYHAIDEVVVKAKGR
jgi:hypothetical protein